MGKQEIGIIDRVIKGEIPIIDTKAVNSKIFKCAVIGALSLVLATTTIGGAKLSNELYATVCALSFCGIAFAMSVLFQVFREMKYNTVAIKGDFGTIIDTLEITKLGSAYSSVIVIRRDDGTVKSYGLCSNRNSKTLQVGNKVYVFTMENPANCSSNIAVFDSESYYVNNEDTDIINRGSLVNSYGVMKCKA